MAARRLHGLALAAALPLLAACENSATAYPIEGNQHALVLIREQPYFWDEAVDQAIVVSRLPQCQKRVTIHPERKGMAPMEVFAAGDRLWALHQGNRWYLAGTEACLVQDWDKPDDTPPGPLVGTFRLQNGLPAFVTAEAS